MPLTRLQLVQRLVRIANGLLEGEGMGQQDKGVPPNFYKGTSSSIATWLHKNSEDYAQAIKRITAYMNRAAGNLSDADTKRLEDAKVKLKKLYQREAAVKVQQWGRRNEYDVSFLKMLVHAIVDIVPGAKDIPLTVEFRERGLTAEGGHFLGKHEWDQLKDHHTIVLDKKQALKHIADTVAHEIGHAVQYRNKQLSRGPSPTGEHGWIWEGRWFPMTTELKHDDRPWEVDARRYEAYGAQALKVLQDQGLVPQSSGDKMQEQWKAKGLIPKNPVTMGDLDGLPDDQVMQIIKGLKGGTMTETEAWEIINAAK